LVWGSFGGTKVGGERPEERAALEWLEKQNPPLIEASPADARPAATDERAPNVLTIDPAAFKHMTRAPAAVLSRVGRWEDLISLPTSGLQALAAANRGVLDHGPSERGVVHSF
jgi:hypothetical protein